MDAFVMYKPLQDSLRLQQHAEKTGAGEVAQNTQV
jgi:hypothetical protein